MRKESFGHWLFHCHYYEDVDPIIVSSRCPSQLLCLVGELLLSFLMVNFCFLSRWWILQLVCLVEDLRKGTCGPLMLSGSKGVCKE